MNAQRIDEVADLARRRHQQAASITCVAEARRKLFGGFYDQPCILAVAAHDMTQRDGVWVAEPETCQCDLRDRQWNPNTVRCESCGRWYRDPYRPEPVVTPDEEPDFLANVKAAFNREDSASFHEPDMDHAEPHDTPGQRVIPAPGTAKVEEPEYVREWDGGE